MITRIVFGTNEELLNINDVQETIQNNGEYVKRALTINIIKDSNGQLPTITLVEELLRKENALKSIKIYKKDIVSEVETDTGIIITYGDEYLESEHAVYSTIQSIIKHSDGGMISIILIIDPTDIAGDKAKQLEQENIALKEQLLLQQNTLNNLSTIIDPVIDKTNIVEYKNYLINQSKEKLNEYLLNNPLQWVDGKYYSVTADKQSLLANAIQVYQMKVQSGLTAELKWNSTGEECTIWTLENLTALALAIANYVEPLVAKQQSLEVQIKDKTTVEELDAIIIDYTIL